MGYIMGLIGVAVFLDGAYSLLLYTDRRDSRAAGQSWLRDHIVRIVRMALGLALVAIGGLITWTS